MFLLRLCINQPIHYLRLYRSLYSNTIKIWKLRDSEQMKVTQCSDVKFDEATNFHTVERPANEKDVRGLPEEEPIYAEDRITLPPALKGHAPALQGDVPALQGHTPAL